MEGTVIAEKVYSVTINGVTFPDLREHSNWNGLTELRSQSAKLIVALHPADGGFSEAFGDLFGGFFGRSVDQEPRQLTLISADPKTLLMLNPPKEPQA